MLSLSPFIRQFATSLGDYLRSIAPRKVSSTVGGKRTFVDTPLSTSRSGSNSEAGSTEVKSKVVHLGNGAKPDKTDMDAPLRTGRTSTGGPSIPSSSRLLQNAIRSTTTPAKDKRGTETSNSGSASTSDSTGKRRVVLVDESSRDKKRRDSGEALD